MFPVISSVSIFLCLVLFIRKAELKPRFTAAPPDPFYVLEGNNITFVWQYNLSGVFDRVTFRFLSSSPTRIIVFKRNLNIDAAIPDSDFQGRIQENINATRAEITIFESQRSESGEYEIEVTDSNLPASDKVTVQVQYPPEFMNVSSDVVVVEGDSSVTLECIADGGPEPTITWTKVYANGSDGGVLQTAKQYILETNRNNIGTYRCTASNGIGTAPNHTVIVEIHYPAEINSISDVVVVEGDPSITLDCNADGIPTPTINWTRVYANGSDSGVLGTENQFVLETKRTNSGTYRCTAYNGIGTAQNRTVKVDVNYKPENVMLMVNDSVVCKGDVISITCSADGKPAVHTYQLFENETPVNDGNSSAGVWIRKDLKGGVLNYSCVANNTVGTAEKTVNVTVKVPSKVYPLENITVIEGENGTLTCNVSGSPVMTVTWTEVSSHSQSNGFMRYLTNISRYNAGEYKCEAANDCGNSSASTFLTVLYKPENFKFTVSKTTVCQGSVVTFNCSADGNPHVDTYQLLENGMSVSNGSNSLGIWSRDMSAGGEFNYTCMANNTVGTAYSMSLTVTVNASSSIQAIQDQNVPEGHNFTLTCNVSGTPPLMVSWIKPNDQSVAGKVLKLMNINRSEAGEYTCEASNVCGNATEMARIDVQFKPENVELATSAMSNKACKGDVFNFTCSANANPAVSSFQLLENDTAVLDTNAVGMWNRTFSSGGVYFYKCVANNKLGSTYSTSAMLTVNVPSSIQAIDDQHVTEGQNVTLICNVSGMPPPMVSWMKPGSQRVSGYKLEVIHINRSQAGKYTCEASNECGNATETATIDVQYKPENVQLMSSTVDNKACMGEVISFNCTANANPGVTSYQLFENETAILNTSASGMWNKTLESEGVFVYKCVANNFLGSEYSMSVTVTVNEPSSIIQITQDQNLTEGRNVTLMCNVSGMPPPMVSWMTPESQRVSGYKLEVTNINRSQAGKYTCEASNECGNATDTATIMVLYKPEKVKLTASVMDNKACKGDMIGFNCSADANPSVTSYQLFENDSAILATNLLGMWKRNVSTGGVFVYKCMANNSVGSEVSSFVMVTVNVPSNIQSIKDQNVTEGDNLTLTCTASGMPHPKVSWIEPSGQRHNGHMLEVTHINRTLAGEYRCEASNECGNATETATIDVQYKPENVQFKTSVIDDKACQGNNITFNCSADAKPAVTTYQLFKNDTAMNVSLSEMWSETLTSGGVFVYKCVAYNTLGTASSTDVTVTVYVPTAARAMGNHTAVKGGTIELYCDVSETPPPTVVWTHVKSGKTWNQKKLTIGNIQEDKLGEYRCNANNKCGGDIKSTFILYEGGFCEKPCSDGKSCLQFGATYVCICPKGKTGEKCQGTDTPKKDFDVGLKLKGEFKQEYENLENPETKTLVKKVEKNMMEEFKGTGLASVKVLKLRQGSIIADLKLTFNDSVGESSVNALLTQAANRGKIGDMEVEDISVGKTFSEPTTTSVPPEDCGTFFEGEDCKKAKPGLIVLCVIGGVAVLAIIVAIIAYGLHKKKSNVASFSNGNYTARADPDGTAGSAERTLQGNNYGNVNSGYEYDKTNGQDHSTEMVTFKGTNPAQTPGIAINDSSMTKKAQPGEGMYADLGEFYQKAPAPPTTPVKMPPEYETTEYAEISQFLRGPVKTDEEKEDESNNDGNSSPDKDSSPDKGEDPSPDMGDAGDRNSSGPVEFLVDI